MTAVSSSPSIVIAIDGLSASGKGTLARMLAAHMDFAHLDTGLLYRATGLAVLRTGGDPTNKVLAVRAAQSLNPATIMDFADDPALRTDAVSQAASKASAIAEVRDSLLKFQQDFAKNPPGGKKGAVLDGRDIGTVIAPSAPVKVYVTADLAVRANRRYKELRGRGENVTEAAVLADMQARDERDQSRAVVPAKPAEDAVMLDTTSLTVDEAFAAALAIIKDKLKLKQE